MSDTVKDSRINHYFLVLPHERNIAKIQEDLNKVTSCDMAHIEKIIGLHKAMNIHNQSLSKITAHDLSNRQTELCEDKKASLTNSGSRNTKYATAALLFGSGVAALVGPAGSALNIATIKNSSDIIKAVADGGQVIAKVPETIGSTWDSGNQANIAQDDHLTKIAHDQQQSYEQSANQAFQSNQTLEQSIQKMREARDQITIALARMQ